MAKQTIRCSVVCHKCKQQMNVIMPEKPGKYFVICSNPDCKARVSFTWAGEKKANIPSNGQLTQIKRLSRNKTFRLMEGDNIIGRADKEYPSKISIKDDEYISRQSVNIEVIRTSKEMSKGYMFKFSVLRASNGVWHNQRLLKVGESIYLNYGDNIVLGKTHFRFEKLEE